jgi:type IV secretory pathway TrbL component
MPVIVRVVVTGVTVGAGVLRFWAGGTGREKQHGREQGEAPTEEGGMETGERVHGRAGEEVGRAAESETAVAGGVAAAEAGTGGPIRASSSAWAAWRASSRWR